MCLRPPTGLWKCCLRACLVTEVGDIASGSPLRSRWRQRGLLTVRQRRILSRSRALGAFLAVAVVVSTTSGVLELRALVVAREAVGRAEARRFIDQVRVCHRKSFRTRLTWGDCEQRVRALD